MAERVQARNARAAERPSTGFDSFELRKEPVTHALDELFTFVHEADPVKGIELMDSITQHVSSLREKLQTEHERRTNERASTPAYEPKE